MRIGQVAMEYLLIASFTLFLISIFIYFGMASLHSSQSEIKTNLAKDTLEKIGQMADWVYSQGEPSRVTFTAFLPDNVYSITIENNVISFKLKNEKTTDLFYMTRGNLTGSILPLPGNHIFLVEAVQGLVNITVVQ